MEDWRILGGNPEAVYEEGGHLNLNLEIHALVLTLAEGSGILSY